MAEEKQVITYSVHPRTQRLVIAILPEATSGSHLVRWENRRWSKSPTWSFTMRRPGLKRRFHLHHSGPKDLKDLESWTQTPGWSMFSQMFFLNDMVVHFPCGDMSVKTKWSFAEYVHVSAFEIL